MEESVILYPAPLMGHLISLVELGKSLLRYHPSLSITVLTYDAPFPDRAIARYIADVSAAVPSIQFRPLPHIPPPDGPDLAPPQLFCQLARLHNQNFRHAVRAISRTRQVIALVFDFFNDAALEAAGELDIPGYYFFTTSASCLTTLLNFPILHQRISYFGMGDLESVVLDVPGVPQFPAKFLPAFSTPQNSLQYTEFLRIANQMRKADGIIVNTFEALEERAVRALNDGVCVPDNRSPAVYCIGPLISSNGDEKEHECLRWLSSQSRRSIVFLSFGSMGLFSKKQLWEIAQGLERSGYGFLWVVRNPPEDPSVKQSLSAAAEAEANLEELLPEGFIERTRGRGLVVKSWAPQVAVLSHDSVGGFVSHCGWNSVLEAVRAGVPILAWPLYAEQQMSAVFLVEQIKVALPLAEGERDGFVTASELERGVRELMETERGEKVRQRVMAMRDAAAAAMVEGGSSIVALSKLVRTSDKCTT